ncbi:MAG: hypothetical protein A2X48_14560 [Lentisphaerae bacterium GWF2_49_21]|nr:MAG: hypothetical protein A2X48_14560 [Lentisphaerae bacterium GWF2_49_21]
MEKQELLFIPDELDREFAEIDDHVSIRFPDYAAVTEERRRVAYFLVSCIRTEKMPAIAAKAKVSLGRCYELVKDPSCRDAQTILGRVLHERNQAQLQANINAASEKIAKFIQAGKIKQLSKDMLRVCHSAETQYQLSPRDLVLVNLNWQSYLLADGYIPADTDCIQKVKESMEAL